VGILRGLSILDESGWKCFANFSCSSVRVILVFLAGASVPADEPPVLSADSQGFLPLDPTRSSPSPSVNRLPVSPFLNIFRTEFKKKNGGKNEKNLFLYLCQSRVP
jgi:hypothetical protein